MCSRTRKASEYYTLIEVNVSSKIAKAAPFAPPSVIAHEKRSSVSLSSPSCSTLFLAYLGAPHAGGRASELHT